MSSVITVDPTKEPTPPYLLDEMSAKLWAQSKDGDTFIGICRLDTHMAYIRPCFNQVAGQLISYKDARILDEKDLKRYEIDGKPQYVVVDLKKGEIKQNVDKLIQKKQTEIKLLTEKIKKLEEMLLDESKIPQGKTREQVVQAIENTKRRMQAADEKSKFYSKFNDTIAGLDINQTVQKREYQELVITNMQKDSDLRSALVDGTGHKNLAIKIQSDEAKSMLASRAKLHNGELISDNNTIGFAILGSQQDVEKAESQKERSLVAFSSGRNMGKFNDPSGEDPWHEISHTQIPKPHAQDILDELNRSLVLNQKKSKPLRAQTPRYDAYKLITNTEKIKKRNEQISHELITVEEASTVSLPAATASQSAAGTATQISTTTVLPLTEEEKKKQKEELIARQGRLSVATRPTVPALTEQQLAQQVAHRASRLTTSVSTTRTTPARDIKTSGSTQTTTASPSAPATLSIPIPSSTPAPRLSVQDRIRQLSVNTLSSVTTNTSTATTSTTPTTSSPSISRPTTQQQSASPPVVRPTAPSNTGAPPAHRARVFGTSTVSPLSSPSSTSVPRVPPHPLAAPTVPVTTSTTPTTQHVQTRIASTSRPEHIRSSSVTPPARRVTVSSTSGPTTLSLTDEQKRQVIARQTQAALAAGDIKPPASRQENNGPQPSLEWIRRHGQRQARLQAAEQARWQELEARGSSRTSSQTPPTPESTSGPEGTRRRG